MQLKPAHEFIAISNPAQIVEEIRHIELAIRVNAWRHITVLADAIGPQRCRDELIPYICGMRVV